ncbi:hypothetical protein [Nocardioides taihuensis]|uniref:DNA-binding domain-containing protein n=1 Tax=Nocardioides taihuensis TaxID=1835606 RepID=A0ABW0BE71_9ACTN
MASAVGVSRLCLKTWVDRYAAEGEPGLATRSSRPTRPSRALPARQRTTGSWDLLGPEPEIPPHLVSRILHRH